MGSQIMRQSQESQTKYPLMVAIFILALGAIYFFASGAYLSVMILLGGALVFSALSGGVVPMPRNIRLSLLAVGYTLAITCTLIALV